MEPRGVQSLKHGARVYTHGYGSGGTSEIENLSYTDPIISLNADGKLLWDVYSCP